MGSQPARKSIRFFTPGYLRGFSLLELIVFIVIVGVGVSGILLALNTTVGRSADPLANKQALAIAEALLEEVRLMPFTYCDPDDSQAATATSATVGVTGCQATVEGVTMGPEGSGPTLETRTTGTPAFDNVNDYNGYSSAATGGIKDIGGNTIGGLGSYAATVSVAASTLGAIGNDGNGRPQVLFITVTVTGPGNTRVVLEGYRVRYAPNSLS